MKKFKKGLICLIASLFNVIFLAFVLLNLIDATKTNNIYIVALFSSPILNIIITKLLKRTVKAIFMARRKNVKNSLLNAGFIEAEHALNNVGIDKMTRGEKLSIEQIQKLSIALEEFN